MAIKWTHTETMAPGPSGETIVTVTTFHDDPIKLEVAHLVDDQQVATYTSTNNKIVANHVTPENAHELEHDASANGGTKHRVDGETIWPTT